MRIAFVVNDLHLSGGISTVVEHARRLTHTHRFDVALVLAREAPVPRWNYEPLEGLTIISLADAKETVFDISIATWWETLSATLAIPATHYAYFVQNLEERFYQTTHLPDRLAARLTHDLQLNFITEARWIAHALAHLGHRRVYYVRNGIDKEIFTIPQKVEVNRSEPLHVLIEGRPSVWFKGVPEALHAVSLMQERRTVVLVSPEGGVVDGLDVEQVVGPLSQRELAQTYASVNVVLKLSRVEGMFAPPLEGFHRGTTCVVTPVTGYDEYVSHGWNGLIVDWDDAAGTARQLDLLGRDRRLLHHLRMNAIETARTWPSWDQSSQFMAGALEAIHRRTPMLEPKSAARLLADVRSGIELYRLEVQRRDDLLRSVPRPDEASPRANRILALARRPQVRRFLRPLRPFVRAARRLRR